MSYLNLPCFLKVSCCHSIISNAQLYSVMNKTSFLYNWTLLIENFKYFYKHDHRKILFVFVYFIFLHTSFWKVKKWSEFLMRENISCFNLFTYEIAPKVFPHTLALSLSVYWHWLKTKMTSVLNFCNFFPLLSLKLLSLHSRSQSLILALTTYYEFFFAVLGWVRLFSLYLRYQGSGRRTCCFLTASLGRLRAKTRWKVCNFCLKVAYVVPGLAY